MPLSANTLIHFTDGKDALKSILEDNFRVHNCRETVILGGAQKRYIAPMVCFCDIPLSEVKDHISKYGCYGLGMTKEWAVRKGLNPVFYVAQSSALSGSYRWAFEHFVMKGAVVSDISTWTDEEKALADVLRYIKNYEADLIRKGVTTPNYRFSDEREWRFVPSYKEDCHMLVGTEAYADPDHKAAIDSKLEGMRLEFEPNDIKYVIIKDDSEIAEFVEHLRRAKGKKYSFQDVERLTTRLLTAEQIRVDM